MTVLIAGAGIGGLVLGLSLRAQDIPFHIYESVAEIAPLGVGINVQPHAVRELTEMGLGPQLAALGIKAREVAYFSAQGGRIWSEARGEFAGYNWPQYSVHRGGLQMMLLEALHNCTPECLTLGARVTEVADTKAGVSVSLSHRDGGQTTAEGAVLVAADGIHSALRAQFHPTEGPPKWGGTVMWRGTTIAQPFLTGATMAMIGRKDQKFVVYPIENRADGTQLINWIADLTKPADYLWNREDWTRKGNPDDFAPLFADWDFPWLDVPALIADAGGIYEYPMVDRDPLERWTYGNTTLLGDAAHAMYPIGSNGASQVILDARTLTRTFLDHGVGAGALQAYEEIRRWAVNKVVLANRGDGPDKILDEVAARAPNGFQNISEVMDATELEAVASRYKTIAGFDVDGLNARPPIV